MDQSHQGVLFPNQYYSNLFPNYAQLLNTSLGGSSLDPLDLDAMKVSPQSSFLSKLVTYETCIVACAGPIFFT